MGEVNRSRARCRVGDLVDSGSGMHGHISGQEGAAATKVASASLTDTRQASLSGD